MTRERQGAMPSFDSSPWFQPGDRVTGTEYLVERWLGAGGMGAVYAVRHRQTGERRALKVLSPYVANRPDLARRLVLEGQVLSRLRSPHAVRVHEVDWLDDGRPYFVMDLLHGETLHDALARGPLPPARACGYVYQVLGALADLHRANLVHRDVKPANLFVRASDGVCVLLDFGLVKVLTEGGPFRPWQVTTGEGVALGTSRYMPPEAGGGERPDARADVYAAGVVLAELLAGELALGELDETAYLKHLEAHGFPVPAGVPAELRRVIEWATQNDPDERLASATRFAAELGWACQAAGIDLEGARPASPPPPPPPPPPSRERARRALGVVPAALASGFGWGAAAALAATWWASAPALERLAPEPRLVVRATAPAPPAAVAPTAAPVRSAAVAPTAVAPAESSAPGSPAPSAAKRRATLEAKMASLEAALRQGKGGLTEARALRRVCRELGDKDCYERSYDYLDHLRGSW